MEENSSCSSDDQNSLGSFNSVVHVSPSASADASVDGEHDEDGDNDDGDNDDGDNDDDGGGNDDEACDTEDETPELPNYADAEDDAEDEDEDEADEEMDQLRPLTTRHASTDSSESDSERLPREDTTSTSSSDGTQIWVSSVAAQRSRHVTTPAPQHVVRHGSSRSESPAVLRHSLVSAHSVTGRVESSILVDHDGHLGGDSGISNESPETQSSGEYVAMSRGAAATGLLGHVLALESSPPCSPRLLAVHCATGCPSPSAYREPTGDQQRLIHLYCRDGMFSSLSALYATFLITFGVVLPVAGVCTDKITSGLFEGFYIFLYVLSIFFLFLLYALSLRAPSFAAAPSSLSRARAARGAAGTGSVATDVLLQTNWRARSDAADASHSGSFYLRTGAIVFGVGAMIYEGLVFGQLFERHLLPPCFSPLEATRPVCGLVFTFVQLYFIFLNSKIRISKHTVLARFALMHMMSCNLCVWLRTVAVESFRVASHDRLLVLRRPAAGADPPSDDVRPPNGRDNATLLFTDGDANNLTSSSHLCHKHDIMTSVVASASPYLYPCSVHYSLIAAGVLYVIWRGVVCCQFSGVAGGLLREKKRAFNELDCSSASRGLFLGILSLVAAIICVIVFFVLVVKPQFSATAVSMLLMTEIALYASATVAVAIAAWLTRELRYHVRMEPSLDDILQVVSLAGQFAVCVLGMLASRAARPVHSSLLLTSRFVIALQSVAQTVFIVLTMRKSPMRPLHEVRKPGRQFITFLLVVNVALWSYNAFEEKREQLYPLQREFFGVAVWSVLNHLTLPLAIFFRFHSTVCLATIWKDLYKAKTMA